MKRYSLITPARFCRYVDEAQQLYDVVSRTLKERNFHIFSGALMGAQLVKAATKVMGGDLKWWFKFMESEGDQISQFMVPTPAGSNFPGDEGST